MADITKAIKAINPNAKFTMANAEDYNSIDWYDTPVISEADINSKITELNATEVNEKEQRKADQANGNQKLLDLGLTQAEATALTGYTPPVAE